MIRLASLAFLVVALSAGCQTYERSVIVLDAETREPIADARVAQPLMLFSGPETQTDARGRASLDVDRPEVEFIVSKEGYCGKDGFDNVTSPVLRGTGDTEVVLTRLPRVTLVLPDGFAGPLAVHAAAAIDMPPSDHRWIEIPVSGASTVEVPAKFGALTIYPWDIRARFSSGQSVPNARSDSASFGLWVVPSWASQGDVYTHFVGTRKQYNAFVGSPR